RQRACRALYGADVRTVGDLLVQAARPVLLRRDWLACLHLCLPPPLLLALAVVLVLACSGSLRATLPLRGGRADRGRRYCDRCAYNCSNCAGTCFHKYSGSVWRRQECFPIVQAVDATTRNHLAWDHRGRDGKSHQTVVMG